MRLSVLAAGLLMAAGQVALAAPPTTIQDPTNVNRNMTVNADGSINVTGSSSSNASVGTNGAAIPGSSTQIGTKDGSGNLQPASTANPVPVSAASLPLPTGAATSANQSTEIGSLATIATNSGSSIPAGTNAIGTVQPGTTPACGSVLPISQTASTDLHTASGKTYICSMLLVVPDAEVVSLVEGTGSVCATGVAALVGATTAANGMSFAANGGVFSGGGGFIWLPMQTTSDHLCLLQSGSGRIAGVITYNDH